MKVYDFIMGVGKKFYPTPEHFIKEAKKMGISKRVPFVPRGLIFGKSKVYLVHWGTNEIFAFFIPTRIDVIADPEKSEKMRRELREAGAEIRDVSAAEALSGDVRGCGSRVVGGTYICAGGDPEETEKIFRKYANMKDTYADVAGPLVVLKKPIPFTDKFFRGIRYAYVNPKTGRYFLLKNPFSRRK